MPLLPPVIIACAGFSCIGQLRYQFQERGGGSSHFIITVFRGVGASVAHTWRGIRAVPSRACGALLDLAGKREHRNSDQVISATKPILLRRDAQDVGKTTGPSSGCHASAWEPELAGGARE